MEKIVSYGKTPKTGGTLAPLAPWFLCLCDLYLSQIYSQEKELYYIILLYTLCKSPQGISLRQRTKQPHTKL